MIFLRRWPFCIKIRTVFIGEGHPEGRSIRLHLRFAIRTTQIIIPTHPQQNQQPQPYPAKRGNAVPSSVNFGPILNKWVELGIGTLHRIISPSQAHLMPCLLIVDRWALNCWRSRFRECYPLSFPLEVSVIITPMEFERDRGFRITFRRRIWRWVEPNPYPKNNVYPCAYTDKLKYEKDNFDKPNNACWIRNPDSTLNIKIGWRLLFFDTPSTPSIRAFGVFGDNSCEGDSVHSRR